MPQDGAIDVADVVQSLALIIMSDQIRDDIQDTLQAFRDEGLKLKVISGDNLETVRAIARDSGMSVEKTTTGAELDAMARANSTAPSASHRYSPALIPIPNSASSRRCGGKANTFRWSAMASTTCRR